MEKLKRSLGSFVVPLLSILLAFIIGGIIMVALGADPFAAVKYLFQGAFGSKGNIGTTLTKATPLMFTSLCACFAYKCGVFNLGGEGQMLMGALGMTLMGVPPISDKLGMWSLPIGILLGIILGAAWSAVAGFFRVKFHASEIVVTLMLNYTAEQFISYMVFYPLRSGAEPQSAKIAAALPKLYQGSRINLGVIIALALTVVYAVVIRRTRFGYHLRALGGSQRAAAYSGVNKNRYYFLAMLISGAFCGLAGAVQISGNTRRLMEGVAGDFGFSGIVVAMLVAMVLLGGIKRIGSVSERLVPFMALFYIVLAVGVVVLNLPRFPLVLEAIFAGAFNPAAFTGGTIGSLFISMQKGVSRGIFSNEAGLGTGSIAHACADTKKPVKQGMFGIFEVFADTIVICTLTAMVILCSGTTVNYGTAAGAELTISGFTTTYGGWASIFTAVALCCFAFSTIIGWGLYGSRFLVFLCRSDKVAKPFFLVYSFVSILGATMDLGLLWSIADTFNGLMSIPNLLALLLLSGTVVRLTKEFFASEG